MEEISNTTGIVTALALSEEKEVEMILGPVFKLRRAGVIRPGIMVLKKSCTPEQHKTYNDMLAQGKDWDDIARIVGRENLIPKNCDYFTVNPIDCNNPKDAETIHKLYADPDGKLRSFPVWFPINEWWNIIPHSLRCFGTTGLKFKSEIINGEMVCHFPAQPDPAIKTFGGRDWKTRKCEPSTCSEFQKGECKFGGVVNCFIPGIKGMNQWVIPTTSWNALANIKSTLEVSRGLLGRVSGLLNGQPFFRIRKVKETVYHINNEGKRVPSDQWIIILDCEVDPMDLVKSTPQTTVEHGREAVAMLEPPRMEHYTTPTPHKIDAVLDPKPLDDPMPVLDIPKILERISKIQNIYEAANWLKKHQAEIDSLSANDKNNIMSAYNAQVEAIEAPQEPPQSAQKEIEQKTTHKPQTKEKEQDKGLLAFFDKALKTLGEEKFQEVLAKHKFKSINDIPADSYRVRGEIVNEFHKLMGKKK